jgi:hypothetical protein
MRVQIHCRTWIPFPCPRLYGYAELLFLQRSNGSRSQPIIEALPIDSFDTETFFSTSDLSFPYDPGIRVLVGHRLHHWLGAGSILLRSLVQRIEAVPGTPGWQYDLTFPGCLGTTNVFSDMDRIWIRYWSSIQGGEWNLVHCDGCCTHPGKTSCDPKEVAACDIWCPRFEWFVGFRYLNVSERLRIDAQRFVLQADDTFGTEAGFYDISTRNNLFGPQIGARVRRWNDRLGWEAGGKVGLLYNDAQQRQMVVDFPDFAVRPRTGASGGEFAYLGELNVTGLFRLNDVWNLRAGYNVIYLGGLALAPNQLDSASQPTRANNSTAPAISSCTD